MNNEETNKAKNKNLTYIVVFTIAIIVVLITVIAINSNNKNSSTNKANTKNTPAISVVSQEGNENETVKGNIKLRKITFSKSIKKVKKFEAKQKDTLDNPSTASSQDGYTYLSYKFNPEKRATFFGTQVVASDPNAMLTYVFYKNKLIEVRVQYGAIGTSGYDAIIASSTSEYGNPTYSLSYNNGAKRTRWKTTKHTLEIIYENNLVIAYYRLNQ